MAPYNNLKRWFDYLTSKDAIKLVGDKMETKVANVVRTGHDTVGAAVYYSFCFMHGLKKCH